MEFRRRRLGVELRRHRAGGGCREEEERRPIHRNTEDKGSVLRARDSRWSEYRLALREVSNADSKIIQTPDI